MSSRLLHHLVQGLGLDIDGNPLNKMDFLTEVKEVVDYISSFIIGQVYMDKSL